MSSYENTLFSLLLFLSIVSHNVHAEVKVNKADSDEVFKLPLRMPNVTTKEHDTYLMTPVKVDYDDAYTVGYIPQVCV